MFRTTVAQRVILCQLPFVMQKLLLYVLISGIFVPFAQAKETLPAWVITLKNDTLRGEISVPKALLKEKERGFAHFQSEVSFESAADQQTTYKPGDIKGFLIFTSDSTFEKFIAASFSIGAMGFLTAEVHTGMSFVRIIDDNGFLKTYQFYDSEKKRLGSDPMLSVPGSHGMVYSGWVTWTLLQKGDAEIKVLPNVKKKRRKALLEFLGDYEKVRTVISNLSFDVENPTSLQTIFKAYNDWYEAGKK